MNSRPGNVMMAERSRAPGSNRFEGAGPAFQRGTSSANDPLPDIVETLYSEHQYMGSLLDLLEQEMEKLAPGKIPDYHLALDVVDYLTHYPDRYHHPREDLLFNALLKRDKSFRKQLDRLEREHESLRGYNAALFRDLQGIADGRRVEQAQLRATLERYIAGYRKHMDFESREIFPLAKGRLTPAALSKLDARTRYIDDPVFGDKLQR